MLQPRVRCVEFVEQVSGWMGGELSSEDCALVEEHMVICPHCDEYAHQIRTAVQALHLLDGLPPMRAPEAAREALLEAFRQERAKRNRE